MLTSRVLPRPMADSAHKLAVLARAAFEAAVDPGQIRCSGIEGRRGSRHEEMR